MKENRRRFLRLIGAGGAIGTSSILAGCGAGDDGADGDGGTDGGDGDGGADGGDGDGMGDGTDGDGTDDGEIDYGGEFITTISSDIATAVGHFAPHRAPGRQATEVNMAFGDTLIFADYDGSFSPQLATDWGVTEEGDAFVMQIREGVQFHPPYEREMKAIDVVENLQAIIDPEYGSVRQGDFVGPVYEDGMDPTEAIDETGEYEVTIHLLNPFPQIEDVLANDRLPIIPMDSYEEHGDDLGTIDVGAFATGAFQFHSAAANDHYTFERFDDYWREGEGGQLPYLDRVKYRVIPEGTSRRAALGAGDIDMNMELRGTDVPSLRENENVTVDITTGIRLSKHWMNHPHYEPASDIHFRRALNFAANKNAINGSAFNNLGEPADTVVPSWHEAYEDHEWEDHGRESMFEEARDEWDQSEHQTGFEMITTQGEQHISTATVLQQNYAQAFDIETTVSPGPRAGGWGEWPGGWQRDPIGPPQEHETAVQDAPAGGFHPHMFTAFMYGTENYMNIQAYSDQEFDQLIDRAIQATSQQQRYDLYMESMEMISRKVPSPPLLWQPVMVAWRTWVHNAQVYPLTGQYFDDLWIDAENQRSV